MSALPHAVEELAGPRFGLVLLRTDETMEGDMRRLLPDTARLHVARLPNAPDITPETLKAMEGEITRAAALLPEGPYDGVAYGCTSATGVIGRERVAALLRAGCDAAAVTDPLSALIDACAREGVRRLGFVSPYIASVSDRLRAALEEAGVAVPHLASFEIASDARVARIDGPSVESAARAMAERDVDAVFLSCTNLRTLDVIARLHDLGKPVWSSNLLVSRALVSGATSTSGAAANEALTRMAR